MVFVLYVLKKKWNHWLWLFSPITYYFFNVLVGPRVPSRVLGRLPTVSSCGVVWDLDVGLVAITMYLLRNSLYSLVCVNCC